MKTGIVVDNYDPLYKGRCKIRVFGLHSETICGQYLILDDDLPWSSPAPNIGSSNGTFNVPSVGERVYVNADDPYNIQYYGQVEVKSPIKDLQYKNTEMSDKLKVIAYSEDNMEGELDYIKIYYLPEEGLTIECNGNSILMTKYDNLLNDLDKANQNLVYNELGVLLQANLYKVKKAIYLKSPIESNISSLLSVLSICLMTSCIASTVLSCER